VGAVDLATHPLTDKFLYKAIILVNAYQCAKFQLPISISFGDMKILGPKLAGVWLGEHSKKFCDPYLFLQQLQLVTSNLSYNLGSRSTYQNYFYSQK